MRRRTIAAGIALALLFGSVTAANSPYAADRHTERNPVGPEFPAEITAETASEYLRRYEETVLSNALLGSRGFTTDAGDEIRADCEAIAVRRTGETEYRVRLRCLGQIVDAHRLVQSRAVSYTVTYRMSDEGPTELSVEGYPLESRDDLWLRPPS